MRRRSHVAGVLAAVFAVLVTLPATALAQGTQPETETEEPTEPVDQPSTDLGVYGVPIRFTAPEGIVMELSSGRRLVDTLELRPNPNGDGFVAIAAMDMEEYVEGIGEMPTSWPLEALKSQAVAARTYAWYQIELGTFQRRGLGYDICATTACQVFRGRQVIETPETGKNWERAVEETRGEVLLHDGAPILARYYSTSGGATRDNEAVFAREGPRPYLKGQPDPDDAISPLHRWEVVFTRSQFNDLLGRGDTLSAVSPVADIRVEKKGAGVPDVVVVTGRNGTTRRVTTGQLLRFLNDLAPQYYPRQFPGPRSDGGTLPSTVPSTRYRFEVTDDQIIMKGSGWGHGVGLGQYGAKGKAERGLDYREILGFYYNGLQPQTPDSLPDRVRVGLANDVGTLTVRGDGPLQVTAGDRTITTRGIGTWTIEDAGNRTTRLTAPVGYGAPLVAGPTSISRAKPFAIETVRLETVVNKPSELRLEVTAADGTLVSDKALGVVDPGRFELAWTPTTDDGELLPSGDYDVALVASDEDATEAGDPVAVTVVGMTGGDQASSLLPDLTPVGEPRLVAPLPVLLAAVLGAVLGGVVGVSMTRRPKASNDDLFTAAD